MRMGIVGRVPFSSLKLQAAVGLVGTWMGARFSAPRVSLMAL